jgi:hypothetical protein
MNTYHKGFANLLLVGIGLLIILGSGAAWWLTQKQAPQGGDVAPSTLPIAPDDQLSPADRVVNGELKNLSGLLAIVIPAFVNEKSGLSSSTSAQVASHIANILEARREYTRGQNAPISPIAIGKRYVMYDGQALKCAGFSIMDSVTGNVAKQCYYPGDFRTMDTLVLIGEAEILTCKIDTPACILLPGSQLSAGEIYGNSENISGIFAPPLAMSHTDTSLTISSFRFDQSSTTVKGTTGTYPLKKVRDLTFALPQ